MSKATYQQIWQTVLSIPPGKVASYGQIADLAVGKVLGYAPAELQVPWYRVLRSDRQLAFAEGSATAEEQRQRLLAEGVLVKNNRVSKEDIWQPDLSELLFKLQF